jgi:glycerate 2-kinase
MVLALEPEQLLRNLFAEAVDAADPVAAVAAALPSRPEGRVLVVGAGKASARMAEAVEAQWGACEGLIITRYGYGRDLKSIEVVEAGHPVPDEAGHVATLRMLKMLEGLNSNDFVLALISGGASALLVAPVQGVSLADKQEMNRCLLASGAPISVINSIRKHLSLVKGGQLAAASWPARMLALAISDIPGDDLGLIGSGPTVGETSSAASAIQLAHALDMPPPASIVHALSRSSTVVQADDIRLANTTSRIVAAPSQSLQAAAEMAGRAGCDVIILGDDIEGEARDVAVAHAKYALEFADSRSAASQPLVVLSGGELTVTRRGTGIGGPNAEYALALAIALRGAQSIYAIACDTDGVDGAAEVAGAIVSPMTLKRARDLSLDAQTALDANDSHNFFATLKDQVITGPTLTNVNDFRAILILPSH